MNRTNLKLMENWRQSQNTITLPIDSISIDYETHLNAIEKGFTYKTKGVAIYPDGREIPIVVRHSEVKEGEYILLFGLGQLKKVKDLNRSSINAVVVNESRTGLIKSIKNNYSEYWDIEDIRIKKSYAESSPSIHKILKKAKNIVGGKTEPIVVGSKSGYLIDGYITYLLLKISGENKVKVVLR